MLTFSTYITAPLESFLNNFRTRYGLAIDLGSFELIGSQEDIFVPRYEVKPLGSLDYFDKVHLSSAIGLEYRQAREVAYGSRVKTHYLRIVSASVDHSDSINNRDFCLASIEYGLQNEMIGFSHHSTTGSMVAASKVPQVFLAESKCYICSASFSLTLGDRLK